MQLQSQPESEQVQTSSHAHAPTIAHLTEVAVSALPVAGAQQHHEEIDVKADERMESSLDTGTAEQHAGEDKAEEKPHHSEETSSALSARCSHPRASSPSVKTAFSGPASGRGLVDLMNPTDALATVAAAAAMAALDEPQTSPGCSRRADAIEENAAAISMSNMALRVAKPEQKQASAAPSPCETPLTPDPMEADADTGPGDDSLDRQPDRTEASSQKQDAAQNDNDDSNDDNESGADSEVTRCPCGSTASAGFMMACDQCNTWQHSKCMGFRRRSDVPDKYFCNVCRPEDMRQSCVAHPKYRERALAREREGRDRGKEFDPILSGVKPLELRGHFAADLKARRDGAKLPPHRDMILRYASLYRNQFGKDRQSVIEGLVVVTTLQRADVVEHLEAAIRKLRNSSASGDISSEDAPERRLSGSAVSADSGAADIGQTRSHGHGRGLNQHKRARPRSLVLDSPDAVPAMHGDVTTNGSNGCSAQEDAEHNAVDFATARNMSREDRKLQEIMRMFAKMEERDRKKPRTGEPGVSPRMGSLGSPTVNGSNCANTGPKLGRASSPHTPPGNPVAPQSRAASGEPRRGPTATFAAERPSKSGSAALNGTLGPTSTVHSPKRERHRERSDRNGHRRREARSLTAAAGSAASRRRGLLDKERRPGTSGSLAARPTASTKLEDMEKLDPVLAIRVVAPGPSVLGSSLVPMSRRSSLDRKAIEAEAAAREQARLPNGTRCNRKRWLLDAADKRKDGLDEEQLLQRVASGVPPRYPLKKRVTLNAATPTAPTMKSDLTKDGASAKGETNVGESALEKKEAVHAVSMVSMVVVSERNSLPDQGKQLEASRLILPAVMDTESVAAIRDRTGVRADCLRKRAHMLLGDERPEPNTAPALSVPAPSTPKGGSRSTATSPKTQSPRAETISAMQTPSGSSLLRSVPAPSETAAALPSSPENRKDRPSSPPISKPAPLSGSLLSRSASPCLKKRFLPPPSSSPQAKAVQSPRQSPWPSPRSSPQPSPRQSPTTIEMEDVAVRVPRKSAPSPPPASPPLSSRVPRMGTIRSQPSPPPSARIAISPASPVAVAQRAIAARSGLSAPVATAPALTTAEAVSAPVPAVAPRAPTLKSFPMSPSSSVGARTGARPTGPTVPNGHLSLSAAAKANRGSVSGAGAPPSLISKPIANRSLPVPASNETTAGDVLQRRLQGFVNRSLSSTKDIAGTAGIGSGAPTSGSAKTAPPNPSGSPKAVASVGSNALPSFRNSGGSMSAPWCSGGVGKRQTGNASGKLNGTKLPSNAPQRMNGSGMNGDKARPGEAGPGAVRGANGKVGTLNGDDKVYLKSGAAQAAAWSNYRQRNGWVASQPSGGMPSSIAEGAGSSAGGVGANGVSSETSSRGRGRHYN